MLPVDEILTASQVAALLKVHPRTIYNLVRKGLLPGRKVGGGWRFSKGAILEMVPGGGDASATERSGHFDKGR